eukprot:COSAG02_NODE_1834_length_10718_cov_3.893775_5_plen_104_part_00
MLWPNSNDRREDQPVGGDVRIKLVTCQFNITMDARPIIDQTDIGIADMLECTALGKYVDDYHELLDTRGLALCRFPNSFKRQYQRSHERSNVSAVGVFLKSTK